MGTRRAPTKAAAKAKPKAAKKKKVDARKLLDTTVDTRSKCRYCIDKDLMYTVRDALKLMASEPEYFVVIGTLHRKLRQHFPKSCTVRSSGLVKHMTEHEADLYKQVYAPEVQ